MISPVVVEVRGGGAHLDHRNKCCVRKANPIGRPSAPEDIARAALLLASPLAGYVTGTTLAVDGGSGAGRFGVRPSAKPSRAGES